MMCTNCFAADYQRASTDLHLKIGGKDHVLRGIDCETCPACGEVTFTQAQSLEIDKRRIALEFGAKPLLAPVELKTLRRMLNMNLNEICDLLHIGRNSYGRWERGEVEITPSMNLLVHNLIERILDAPVNIFERERLAAIEQANTTLIKKGLSFGEYLREVTVLTKLIPDIVSNSIGILPSEFTRIEHNELAPEHIPHEVTAKLAHYFGLTFDVLLPLLNGMQEVARMKASSGAVHEIISPYDGQGEAPPANESGAVPEMPAQQKMTWQDNPRISEEYAAQVKAALDRLERHAPEQLKSRRPS